MTSEESNAGLRVLIADDCQLLREIMAAALEEDGFRVVGQAATGEDAIRMAVRLKPDIVVMDVSMPGMGGIAATAVLRRTAPGVHVIAFSLRDDGDTVRQMMQAGACAFVSKGDQERLMSAIRHATGEKAQQPRLRSSVSRAVRSRRNVSMD